MSGRLIIEYREGGHVTRLERTIGREDRSWWTPTKDEVRVGVEQAVSELIAGIPEDEK